MKTGPERTGVQTKSQLPTPDFPIHYMCCIPVPYSGVQGANGRGGRVWLPFGYKAAKEQEDMESYEVLERKTKGARRGRWRGLCLPGEVQRRSS